VSVSTTYKKSAALTAATTLVALVATTASVPTAQAGVPGSQALLATSFAGTNWPASPAVYGTAKFVSGKIKSSDKSNRVVKLEMKLPSGWRKVSSARTNSRGEFRVRVKTNWYHQELKMRLVVKPTDESAGTTGQSHGIAVKPEYRPKGTKGAWSRIAPGYRVQFDACTPVRWRLNNHNAPSGVGREVRRAVKQLAKSTGIKFVYAGRTRAIPGSDRAWPNNTNMVIAWASPNQTNWPLQGDIIGVGGQLATAEARNGDGQRAYEIVQSGLVLDNTFRAPAGFRGPNARGAIIAHELGHVAGLGHTNQVAQLMYPSARNPNGGVYQAGDLTGMRKVGLSTGCLEQETVSGRRASSFVPPPLAVEALR
jgi:hypothetical protein